NGNFSGSPKICAWQSQALSGTSKFTGVSGCDALARATRLCAASAVATVPSTTLRRVGMIFSLLRPAVLCRLPANKPAYHVDRDGRTRPVEARNDVGLGRARTRRAEYVPRCVIRPGFDRWNEPARRPQRGG